MTEQEKNELKEKEIVESKKSNEEYNKEKKNKIKTKEEKKEKDESEKKETKVSTGKEKEKKEKIEVKKETPKKTEVTVNGISLPISTKVAAGICKFIKGKKIERAISDLEQVAKLKKAVPMKGEYPHKKGMMSGKFPKKVAENFIVLLKSLMGNAHNHGIEEPVIVEAVANIAPRPYGRFGSIRKKRTHVRIKSREKNGNKKNGGIRLNGRKKDN